jgi:hypothetical protein
MARCMSTTALRPTQAEFAAALLDAERSLPQGLRTSNGTDPAPRFAVHRNNVVVSLVQALADGFPVVHQLVGDEFFTAMARIYVCTNPPRSPVLAEYGDGLADWIADFEPAAPLPYLADMARLERARVRAFHAADATPLSAEALTGHLAAPQQLAQARLALHPSLAVVRSAWAVASLWAAHQSDDPAAIGSVDLSRAEDALVLRQGDDVLVLPVHSNTAGFIAALASGCPLGEAAASTWVPDSDDPLDLASSLALLIRHGALIAWCFVGDDG